jgi:hypothetical protein
MTTTCTKTKTKQKKVCQFHFNQTNLDQWMNVPPSLITESNKRKTIHDNSISSNYDTTTCATFLKRFKCSDTTIHQIKEDISHFPDLPSHLTPDTLASILNFNGPSKENENSSINNEEPSKKNEMSLKNEKTTREEEEEEEKEKDSDVEVLYDYGALNTKEKFTYRQLQQIFSMSSVNAYDTWFQYMSRNTIYGSNRLYSGRLLYHFFSYYLKDTSIVYYLYIGKHGGRPGHTEYFPTLQSLVSTMDARKIFIKNTDWMTVDLYAQHEVMLERYKKLNFDFVCRGRKIVFSFLSSSAPSSSSYNFTKKTRGDEKKCPFVNVLRVGDDDVDLRSEEKEKEEEEEENITNLESSFCQLNFYSWAHVFHLKRIWQHVYKGVHMDKKKNGDRERQCKFTAQAYERTEFMYPLLSLKY